MKYSHISPWSVFLSLVSVLVFLGGFVVVVDDGRCQPVGAARAEEKSVFSKTRQIGEVAVSKSSRAVQGGRGVKMPIVLRVLPRPGRGSCKPLGLGSGPVPASLSSQRSSRKSLGVLEETGPSPFRRCHCYILKRLKRKGRSTLMG